MASTRDSLVENVVALQEAYRAGDGTRTEGEGSVPRNQQRIGERSSGEGRKEWHMREWKASSESTLDLSYAGVCVGAVHGIRI